MRSPLKLDVARYRELLAPLYAELDAAHTWEHAERAVRQCLALVREDDDETREADVDFTVALAYAFPVRQALLASLRTRTAAEAYFVGLGWTPLRFRELLRGLERLPDKAQTLEERLVADSDALGWLGMYGLARALVASASSRDALEQAALLAQRHLQRRLNTRAAQSAGAEARSELRELIARLRSATAAG